MIDDRSRYAIALFQTGSTRVEAVREQMEQAFTRCGLPQALLMDHGVPWWNRQAAGGWTKLSVWLMQQGIRLYFSGVRHPQTGVPTDRSSSGGWRHKARWSGSWFAGEGTAAAARLAG